MEHEAERAPTRPPRRPWTRPVHPTRFRARSQPWIPATLAALVLVLAGAATGVALLAIVGVVVGAFAARSAWRLRQSLRRLDQVGLTRWSANVAMILLPDDLRRRGIGHVPVPDNVERTPEAVLRHVLADEDRRPTVAPWALDDPDLPRTGGSRATWAAWAAPVAGVVGWVATALVALAIDASATARAVALTVAALPVAFAVLVVARYRIAIHHDGRLEVRRPVGERVLHLDHVLQVSGWTWSLERHHPVDGRPVLHATTLSLVFGDGTHAALHPGHARDDQMIAQALRFWAAKTAAVVTPDVAYALGFTSDPRDDGPVRLAHDDRWMRRPARRLRTAAAHLGAATTPLQPLVLGIGTLLLLR